MNDHKHTPEERKAIIKALEAKNLSVNISDDVDLIIDILEGKLDSMAEDILDARKLHKHVISPQIKSLVEHVVQEKLTRILKAVNQYVRKR